MDWTPVIDAAIKAVTLLLITLITSGSGVLLAWLTKTFAKWRDNWYINTALESVKVGVDFAAKTFVDVLKDSEGGFLQANWGEAMQRCVDAAEADMPNKIMQYIEKTRGDLEAWIIANAEAMLKQDEPAK